MKIQLSMQIPNGSQCKPYVVDCDADIRRFYIILATLVYNIGVWPSQEWIISNVKLGCGGKVIVKCNIQRL